MGKEEGVGNKRKGDNGSQALFSKFSYPEFHFKTETKVDILTRKVIKF